MQWWHRQETRRTVRDTIRFWLDRNAEVKIDDKGRRWYRFRDPGAEPPPPPGKHYPWCQCSKCISYPEANV